MGQRATSFALKVLNTTHGSGWFIQIVSTQLKIIAFEIPPTGVGGLFKSFLKDLKYPPTAVSGITLVLKEVCRKDLNELPTAVGRISDF